MTELEIREEESCHLPVSQLDEATALELHNSGRFEIIFPSILKGDVYAVRSKGWVGQLRLKNGQVLRIAPKIPVKNLFKMLELAYELKSFHIFKGTIAVESIDDIFELLASILARRVIERAKKGLYRNYVPASDELGFVRGRLNLKKIIRNCGRLTPIPCDFEEHTEDLIHNWILFWTVHRLPQFNFIRSDVRRQIRQAHRVLVGSVSLRKIPLSDYPTSYNRLDADYKAMHGICKFFLDHTGPGLGAGDQSFVPFLVNMPRLFESYVGNWLRVQIPTAVVKTQFRAALQGSAKLHFTMDIVLVDPFTGKTLAVIDTKYKNVREPSESDIQQAVAYAVRMGTTRSVLVYPTDQLKRLKITVGHVTVEALPFDITSDPHNGGKTFLQHFNH